MIVKLSSTPQSTAYSQNPSEASYRPNQQHKIRNDKSSLIITLSKTEWIPDKKGNFHKPCDITKEILHKDFPYDDRNGWLSAIGFGENERKKSEEHKTLREISKKIGLSDDAVDFIVEIANLPKDVQKEKIKQYKQQLYESNAKPLFPEKASPNPERRASKIRERLDKMPDKFYETKNRSVRTSNSEVRPEIRTYLRNLYTNGDNEMICQICEEEMPFKLDDGSYYFEAVECICIQDFPKECSENYLALCPVCAAKYKHTNGSKTEDIRSAILNSEDLTIPLILARESKTIRFVKVHIDDLKAVLQSDA